ncbi:mitochondrial inner membrane protease subunit 1-like [Mercurialis annua]|uniref:mitochondrial inner membrane protease subunit 1-like n=1 Tax=Mercurialis annua TaxID=3986 RepID=UPI0021605E3B|nr:mitochondrial inner membrane protease subunit 1-like [Mercurialis annua]
MSLRNISPWKSFAKEALSQSILVAKFLCFLHVTNTYVCTAALTYGPSMLPTLNLTGDLILAEKISHRIGKVGPGDIVLVRSPVNPRRIVTKRVMGVGGDSITYVVDPRNSDRSNTVRVPMGHIWIEGDNVYDSHDSRKFGAVPYGLLQAKVFLRVWPPKDFGPLVQKAN